MRILIMVLSYDEPPYSDLMEMQKETWADLLDIGLHKEIGEVFYHGGATENPVWFYDGTVVLPCTDSYYFMSEKFKLALEYVWGWEWDIIFRTNSSSYINKTKLWEFAQTLPTEGLYAGWEIEGNAGYNIVSGAGFFLSRDTAEILKNDIDPSFEREEDVYCGQLLFDKGIKIIDDKSRFDVDCISDEIPLDRYHYRCKTGNRYQDCSNMKQLHKMIKG